MKWPKRFGLTKEIEEITRQAFDKEIEEITRQAFDLGYVSAVNSYRELDGIVSPNRLKRDTQMAWDRRNS